MHKIEGYWHSEYTPQYPHPIPNVLTDKESRDIFLLIRKKENGHPLTIKFRRSKGYSKSRITGEQLGCGEFETKEFTWPEDFAEHYVLTHKVKPSIDFLKYIGYYS